MTRTCRVLSGATVAGLALLAVGLAGCDRAENVTSDRPRVSPVATQPTQGGSIMKQMVLESSAFRPNETIPRKHTGDGADKSPPLTWSNVPAGTKELAMIVDDPDAPSAKPWVYWVVYRISAELIGLPEGVAPSLRVDSPPGILQGKNSWNRIGYGGPQPPKGHGVHHYHFKLYALDIELSLDPGDTKESLVEAMSGHILAQGELIGTYQR